MNVRSGTIWSASDTTIIVCNNVRRGLRAALPVLLKFRATQEKNCGQPWHSGLQYRPFALRMI
jgi:hypothetical protein